MKIAFMVGGNDIKRLSMMDASFANALAKALTGLTIGKAVIKVTARPGEQQPPPVVVQMDYIQHETRRSNIYTKAFDPGEIAKQDLKSVLNPILKYIDPVRPLELLALYEIYRAEKIALTDLATKLGAPRKDLEDAVARLNALGYIEIEREGNRKVLIYIKGLFKGLKGVAPSKEGYRIARRVLLKYYSKGYVALPVKQDSGLKARPDLVAIPIDKSTWRPLYSQSVAVEIESCNELETHPEHVVHNWVKESTRDFVEIHSWTSEECFERLKQLYDKHPEVHGRVKVFSVKLEKAERAPEHAAPVSTAMQVGEKATIVNQPIVERIVELQGKRYRVVFSSEDDALRFDRFRSLSGAQVSIKGSNVVIYVKTLGKSIAFQARSIEELG